MKNLAVDRTEADPDCQATACAIYARVSRKEKDHEENEQPLSVSDSPKRQVLGARAFITSKSWHLNEEHVYTDDGVSGGLFANRAEFQRMMADAKSGAFEHLVLFDLDRFGRDGHKTMVALNALLDVGVTVWDYSTGICVDLGTFDGRITATLKAEFAEQYRAQIRKHTKKAMRDKAEQGFVTGGKVFGYDNKRINKGQTIRVRNDAEAAVVQEIFELCADGYGLRGIALHLNKKGALSPRAQQGRPNGWSFTTVRAVLERPLYVGEVVWGKQACAWGRELGKNAARESGQINMPENTWIKRSVPDLAIIDPDLAARVRKVRRVRRSRHLASVTAEEGGTYPERGKGKYLLTGGMLVCPTCGGNFEAIKSPWTDYGYYTCATRRRKPGACSNTLSLPMKSTDETVLTMIENEVLGQSYIEELLSLVDQGEADQTAQWKADEDRLQAEIERLIASIAAGIDPTTLAPAIKERERQLAAVKTKLAAPRKQATNIKKLRAALTERAAEWKATLRAEPAVSRMLLRQLVGPLTLWNAAKPSKQWSEWESAVTTDILKGLGVEHSFHTQIASPKDMERTVRRSLHYKFPLAA